MSSVAPFFAGGAGKSSPGGIRRLTGFELKQLWVDFKKLVMVNLRGLKNLLLDNTESAKAFALANFRSLQPVLQTLKFVGLAILATIAPSEGIKRELERRFVYDPVKYVTRFDLKSEALRDKIHDIYFKSLDGTDLHGWYIPAAKNQRGKPLKPTVVFAHGVSSNIGFLEPVLQKFSERGYGIFVMDYRGFGISRGKPDEKGICDDFEAACRHIAKRTGTPLEELIIVGHSLGGAVATEVTSRMNTAFKAVVLVNTFTTLGKTLDHLKAQNPRVGWMVSKNFITQKFLSEEKVHHIPSPLLVISSDQDGVAPAHMGHELARRAREADGTKVPYVDELTLANCDHTNLFEKSEIDLIERLEKFLADAECSRKAA